MENAENADEAARNRAFSKVNEELIMLYWDIGYMISLKLASSELGELYLQNTES